MNESLRELMALAKWRNYLFRQCLLLREKENITLEIIDYN